MNKAAQALVRLGGKILLGAMTPNPSTPAEVSQAASLLGRKAKGVRKTLTDEQREAKRERMRHINEVKRKVKQ